MSRTLRTRQYKQRKRLRLEFFPNNPGVVWTFEALAEQFPDLTPRHMLDAVRSAVKKNRLIIPVRLNGGSKILGWVYDSPNPEFADKENARLTRAAAGFLRESDRLNRAFEPKYQRKLRAFGEDEPAV